MKTVSAITLDEQLDATTGVVASRNRSRLHRLAGASPAANLRPEPAAISDLFRSRLEIEVRKGSLLLLVVVDVRCLQGGFRAVQWRVDTANLCY